MNGRVDPRREEYERFFLAGLRKLLDLDRRVEVWSKKKGYAEIRKGDSYVWKGIGVEEVRLDTSILKHEVIVLLRDLKRPECLFGWRAPAVEPGVLENDLWLYWSVKGAAESHATVVWVNLEEDLHLTSFPKRRACSPGSIAWITPQAWLAV